MSKTKEIKTPTDVQRAEQAYLRARNVKLELLAALEAALEAAKGEEERLYTAARQARTAADMAGPLATISPPRGAVLGQRGEQVAIVRRTASTIWTRPIGWSDNCDLRQWRKSKTRGGGWTEYPAGYYAARTLTIDGEQS